jgi:hypothetical protein
MVYWKEEAMINKIKIREPIWKSRAIGLSETKLTDITEVEITYKDRTGERLYPNTYVITRAEALQYPVQIVRGTRLRIIPISNLHIKNLSIITGYNKI